MRFLAIGYRVQIVFFLPISRGVSSGKYFSVFLAHTLRSHELDAASRGLLLDRTEHFYTIWSQFDSMVQTDHERKSVVWAERLQELLPTLFSIASLPVDSG